jgi:hypothetical protein
MSLEAAVQQLAAQQEKMYNLLVELSNHIPKKEMTTHEVSEFLGLHPVTISRKKHLLGHNGKKRRCRSLRPRSGGGLYEQQ